MDSLWGGFGLSVFMERPSERTELAIKDFDLLKYVSERGSEGLSVKSMSLAGVVGGKNF